MKTSAVILSGPKNLSVGLLGLTLPSAADVVVEVAHSGISTGTEKLFWSGTMPPFPGMGYPLVPGYEAAGEVVEAGAESGFQVGDYVFVPGANCFQNNDQGPVRGLFGAASRVLVSQASRVTKIDRGFGAMGALLALAATARHALAPPNALPDLIVGHGVLGRMVARLAVIAGGAPVVWDTNPQRRQGGQGYEVLDPAADPRRDYRAIYDDRLAGPQSGHEPGHGVEVRRERRIGGVPHPPLRCVAAHSELPTVDGDETLVRDAGEIRSPLPRTGVLLGADPRWLA